MSTHIDLWLLILAEDSNMLIKDSKELPKIESGSKHGIKLSASLELEKVDESLKNFLKDDSVLKNIELKKYIICNSEPKTKDSIFVAIFYVSNIEKGKIESDSKYVFRKTYADDTSDSKKRNSVLTLDSKSADVFTKFNYLTERGTSKLDNCIRDAAPKVEKLSESTTTRTFTFYRPIYPVPIFFPNIFNPYLTPIGVQSPRYSPVSSPMSSPRSSPRFSTEKMVAPRVPRSPQSPRSPRFGGYYEKYMKYKNKYLSLKKELEDRNI